jgi:hypothetical protein
VGHTHIESEWSEACTGSAAGKNTTEPEHEHIQLPEQPALFVDECGGLALDCGFSPPHTSKNERTKEKRFEKTTKESSVSGMIVPLA